MHVELEGGEQPFETLHGAADDGEGELGQRSTYGTADHDKKCGQIEQCAGMTTLDHVAAKDGDQRQYQANQAHFLHIPAC